MLKARIDFKHLLLGSYAVLAVFHAYLLCFVDPLKLVFAGPWTALAYVLLWACLLIFGFVAGAHHPHWLYSPLLALLTPAIGVVRSLAVVLPFMAGGLLAYASRYVTFSRRAGYVAITASLCLGVAVGVYGNSTAVALGLLAALAMLLLRRSIRGALLAVSTTYTVILASTFYLAGYTYAAIALSPFLLATCYAIAERAKPELAKRRKILTRPPETIKPFLIAYYVMAGIMTLDFLAGLVLASTYPGQPLGFAGVSIAAYGLTLLLYYVYRILFIQPEIALRPLKSRWYTAWFVEKPRLYSMLERYTERLRTLLEKAIVLENPILYAAKHAMASIIVLLLTPVSLVLAPISPFAAALATMGFILSSLLALAAPWIVLPTRIGERRRQVENELPWFILYTTTLQAAGIPLYEAFSRLIGKGVLPAMEKEARLIQKRVMVLGRDAITALEEVAYEHPSRSFRELILGYTSILRTGGDLVSYLEDRLKEALKWLEFKLESYSNSATTIAELLVAFFTIFVALFAIAGGWLSGLGMLAAQATAYLGIPLIVAAMYVIIMQSQPKIRYDIPVGHFIPAISLLLLSAYMYVAGIRLGWLSMALVALVLGFSYGIQHFIRMKVAVAHEKALEDFLRDIVEMRKIGLPPARAIVSLARSRTYNVHFDKILCHLASQLRLDVPLPEAVQRTWSPSWLTRIVLFILGEIEATGGGTVAMLEQLHSFISTFNLARKQMVSKLRIYEALVYLTPALLCSFVSISMGLVETLQHQMETLQARLSSSGAAAGLLGIVLNPAAIELARIMAVEASAAFAVLAAKTVDFSLKSLLRLSIVALILIAMNFHADPVIRAMVHCMFAMGK